MKKHLLLFTFFFCVFGFAFGQNPLVKQWDYRYGGTDVDWLTCFQQTSDKGYILGGPSYSGISGDKTQAAWGNREYWIVKTDSLGIKQWDKDFGGTGYDWLSSIQQTSDGGYILGGYSSSGISGDKTQPTWGGYDYWIVKTDALGIKQWDKNFGGTGDDVLYSIQQTADGGYILGGASASGISGDKTQATWGSSDFWIVKTDSLGIIQWEKDFGGTAYDELSSVQQTADGGYILGGYSYSGISGNKTQAAYGQSDYWIVKTDLLGNIQWDKDFGGTDFDYLYSIQQTADNGYILGGNSASGISGNKTQAVWGGTDYWIVKTDSLGIKEWDKDFGGTANEEFFSIHQTTDGGYLFSGDSYSPISGDKTESNLGIEQTWIVKTNSSGNMQWDKTIFTSGHDETGLAIQTQDGCYAIANWSDGGIAGYKTQLAWSNDHDYWLIKFCDTTQCNLSSPEIAQTGDTLFVPAQYTTYQWYHNSIPISGATNYFYVAPASDNYNIIVTDSNGCSVGAGIINVVAGINQFIIQNSQFKITPNPFQNKITIHLPAATAAATATATIYNTLGEVVYIPSFNIQNSAFNIDLSMLSQGIYFLSVQAGDQVYRGKMVRE